MNKKLSIFTTTAVFTVMAATTGFAKDKDKDKDKDRDKDRDRDRDRYSERGDRDRDHDHDRDRDRDRDRNYRDGGRGDRSRTIYVIERNRPVERTVYIDGSGRYYRVLDGRRTYVQERYYESYPSKYYYPDGRRRVTITLPF